MFNIFWRQKVKTEVNTFTLTVLLIGLFPGLGAIIMLGGITFIRIDTVFNFVVVSAAAIFLLHLPFLKRMNRFVIEIISYCLLGWGLIITALFMGSNYIFHEHGELDKYVVKTAVAHPEDRALPFPVSVSLKNDSDSHNVLPQVYSDFPYFLKFEGEEELKFINKPEFALMTTAQGLFGYRVLIRKELR